jgi:hypothetical protein
VADTQREIVSVCVCVTVSTSDVVAVLVCPIDGDAVPETVRVPSAPEFDCVGVAVSVFVATVVAERVRDPGAEIEPAIETELHPDAVLVFDSLLEPESVADPLAVFVVEADLVPVGVLVVFGVARGVEVA